MSKPWANEDSQEDADEHENDSSYHSQVATDLDLSEDSLLLLGQVAIVTIEHFVQWAEFDHQIEFDHWAKLLHAKDEFKVRREVIDIVRSYWWVHSLVLDLKEELQGQREEKNAENDDRERKEVEENDVERLVSLLLDQVAVEVVQ